ncbi:MAG: family 16 glycosylhydrolase [Candidatus Neomarinimicrobiota bacterium]
MFPGNPFQTRNQLGITWVLRCLLCALIGASCPVSAKDYKGGECRTIAAYTYGRFEVRCKPGRGSGQLASFFTYHDAASSDEWNEIDIEIMGRYVDDVQFNTITPGVTNHVRHQSIPFNPFEDFHTYAIEWTPYYVAWFVDGQEVARQTGEHIQTLIRPQKIMMNTWIPTYPNWSGEWNQAILPVFHYYDWVSYASYDSGSGNTGTNNNFTLQWKDDFHSWDTARWAKATHTWEGNNVDFTPENVVLDNGCMILCLTDSVNTGYIDNNPPTVIWARASGSTVTALFSEDVDSISALDLSHYAIPGVSITEIEFYDRRTVELMVSGLNPQGDYQLTVSQIKDLAAPQPNVQTGVVVDLPYVPPLTFPVRLNVGGQAYNDFLPDQQWGYDQGYGYLDGWSAWWGSASIDAPKNREVYKSAIVGPAKYRVRVPDGRYRITMMFSENEYAELGGRVFDVFIENSLIAGKLDIFSRVGKFRAYDILVDSVEVIDGIIDLHFAAVVGTPVLNGLIIEFQGLSTLPGSADVPCEYQLHQNFPNPFNSSTTISFQLARSSYTSLSVYDLRGRKLQTLLGDWLGPGQHDIACDILLPSGVYFYRLDIGIDGIQYHSETRKMILLK